MTKFIRSSIVVLASVALLFGGRGFAQPAFPDSLLRSEWAAKIFVVFEEEFAASSQDRELGNAVVFAMQSGAGIPTPSVSTCAAVLGAGSNPKLDGGGNLLAALPGGVYSPAFVVRPSELAAGLIPDVQRIVIVDEFSFSALEQGFSDSASTDWQDFLPTLWNALYVPDETGVVHHGHLVAYHALAHLESVTDVTATSGAETLELTVDLGQGTVVTVLLVGITFNDPDSLESLSLVFDDLDQGDTVVIMSWGLVDCALSGQYSEASADPNAPTTFVDYLSAALAAAGDAEDRVRDLCRPFKDRINTAVIPAYVDCEGDASGLLDLGTIAAIAAMSVRASEDVGMRENGDWINVSAGVFASAGNQGLPFPMPPAAWPGIVGVEACIRGVPERAGFSNMGSLGWGASYGDQAVRALGAWFATILTSDGNDGAPEGTPLGYWGTSFAAPAAAMHYAAGSFTLVNDLEILDPCERP